MFIEKKKKKNKFFRLNHFISNVFVFIIIWMVIKRTKAAKKKLVL